MRTGVCPKCGLETVYFSDSTGLEHGISIGQSSPFLNIYKDGRWIPDVSMLQLSYYVCRSCGYFETYVRDPAELAKLDDCTNWRKVERH